MAENCLANQYWDPLIKKCMSCRMECQKLYIVPRCTSYCEAANCRALQGHFYDGLLKKCMKCARVCGRHPAECSRHCQATSPPPVTIKKLLADVTSPVPNSRGVSGLGDPNILLYPLLSLCLVLLFSSLSLALVVFLRGARARTSKPQPNKSDHSQESVVQPGQEVGQPCGQPWQSSKDSVRNTTHPTDRKPSYDSSPTETCVCIHCFPDLKALGQGNDRPPRAPFSFYPQAVLHRAQTQKGGPHWREGNMDAYGQEVQEEARVG